MRRSPRTAPDPTRPPCHRTTRATPAPVPAAGDGSGSFSRAREDAPVPPRHDDRNTRRPSPREAHSTSAQLASWVKGLDGPGLAERLRRLQVILGAYGAALPPTALKPTAPRPSAPATRS